MKIDIINKSEFDLPKYQTHGSVGMDLMANLKSMDKDVFYDNYFKMDGKYTNNFNKNRTYKDGLWLYPNKQYLIPTGINISLPKPFIETETGEGWGYEAQIRPRSGLAAKHGITIVNSPGTIDCDYIGEIKIILMNISNIPYKIQHGDRIAQMVINRFEKISWNKVDKLNSTDRGEGGFSSTGR